MPRARPRRVERLTEPAFHRWLRRNLPAGQQGRLPIGDDAAAIPVGGGRVALLSTDALVEGTHFLRRTPPERVGAAAAAVNLSDLAAKGGRPVALLVAVIAPAGTPIGWAERVTLAAERLGAKYGCHVVGGDTKPGPVRSVVGLVLGLAQRSHLPSRHGARPGDVLVVTGQVGRGGAHRGDIDTLLNVRPRVAEGAVLARKAHAMLDTSDGLADSVRLLSEASRVRMSVDSTRLPLDPSLLRRYRTLRRRLEAAFYGGDYELLASVSPRAVSQLQTALRRVGTPLTVIGQVDRGRGAWLSVDGAVRPMPRAGWRSFETL